MFLWTNLGLGLKLQKKVGDADVGGEGVVSDFGHPRKRGEAGSKKGKFLRTFFMDGPIKSFIKNQKNTTRATNVVQDAAWKSLAPLMGHPRPTKGKIGCNVEQVTTLLCIVTNLLYP